ncbi:anther-specific protein LAT52-like [Telopea speciosissima]|uniref:anther-specific protein LAT52-like n=1 Tax=Telopea speciosissima TaxID=54955 RepID=UPI001CC59FBF|nr:anther-specific protein LAT52-like [Telopea speciosissima]
MAKSSQALLIAALFFFGLLGLAHCHDFVVEGRVYCDTCRALFETRVSKPMADAPVRLTCRNRVNGTISETVEAVCDDLGTYKITVDGEHEDDICEMSVVKTSITDCDEHVPGKDRARVVLTHNNGVVSRTRYASPLGFLAKKTLDVCPEVLKELGLLTTVDLSTL